MKDIIEQRKADIDENLKSMNNGLVFNQDNTEKKLEDWFKKNHTILRYKNIDEAHEMYKQFISETITQAVAAEERERVREGWVKYKDKKPEIGQLTVAYRDIESKQIFATEWNKEEENYAEMNKITHWMPIEYPDLLASLPLPDK